MCSLIPGPIRRDLDSGLSLSALQQSRNPVPMGAMLYGYRYRSAYVVFDTRSVQVEFLLEVGPQTQASQELSYEELCIGVNSVDLEGLLTFISF